MPTRQRLPLWGSCHACGVTERAYGKQQRDAKAFAALLDAACCVHLFHHGLDAGEADLGAVGAVLAGEDGIFKGKPGFAVLFDEADGNVLRRKAVAFAPRQCRCAEDSEGYALLSSADCGYAP